ncbi:MAG: glycoside hydrolase family 20 zincin-like fold domain-containing protein, partial [Acidobacteriota bacterium]
MKRHFAAIAVLLSVALVCLGQSGQINIIPKPQSVVEKSGHFVINRDTRIAADKADRKVALLLQDYLRQNYGIFLKLVSVSGRPVSQFSDTIVFVEAGSADHVFPQDYYGIDADNKSIRIYGSTPAGRFYGLQSLVQILPPANASSEAKVPAVKIEDAPRFNYRGMHLDVSRHFQPVEFVKKFIDQMSQYKFNYFHWHL